jgi:hypothetical protein
MLPAAQERDYTIRNEQLVMHPIIKTGSAEGELDAANETVVTTITSWIEDADCHVRLPASANTCSSPAALSASSTIRTRTPRCAARRSASVINRPDSSP